MRAAISYFLIPISPIYLAQYTAEHDRVAPKRRICLDEAHYPAQTVDGKTVQVIAWIDDPAEQVPVAMENGADALFVPFNSTLHRATEDAQRKLMFAMIHEGAGKPVILADPYALPAMLLCEASAEADITVAAPLSDDPTLPGLPERRAELEKMESSCFDNDIPASIPENGYAGSLVITIGD